MPYASDSQRKYFHAAEARGDIKPSTVKEFDSASKGMHLPEHVRHLSKGGYACLSCGGEVGEDGYAHDLAEDDEDESDEAAETPQHEEVERLFGAALKGR